MVLSSILYASIFNIDVYLPPNSITGKQSIMYEGYLLSNKVISKEIQLKINKISTLFKSHQDSNNVRHHTIPTMLMIGVINGKQTDTIVMITSGDGDYLSYEFDSNCIGILKIKNGTTASYSLLYGDKLYFDGVVKKDTIDYSLNFKEMPRYTKDGDYIYYPHTCENPYYIGIIRNNTLTDSILFVPNYLQYISKDVE